MKAAEEDEWRPRDGGLRGWLVVAASFCVNGLVFGLINSYSLIYTELKSLLNEAGEEETSAKAALVGSLTIGATFALSPVAGILTDRYGLRQTTLMGGTLAVIGMLLSSFLTHKVEALYLTYGILFGVGASLAYTPSLAVLCLYFKDRLGMVNGVVTAGSSVFTIVLPPTLSYLLPAIGLAWVLRLLAIIMAGLAISGLLFVPPKGAPMSPKKKALFNLGIWKRKRYVIWALTIPLTLLGYFVPYVHMVAFVVERFPEQDGSYLVMCMGLTSGLGRIVFGKLADLPRVDRILLQQISFVSIGILTMLMIWAPNWIWLVALALGMGLFDGCFISLIGPIAYDLCGPEGAAQGIGFLLGLMSMPMTIGPPLAGFLVDKTGGYTLSFILAGIPAVFGGLALTLVRCVPQDNADASSGPTNGVYKKTAESASLLELDKQQSC